MSFLKRRGEWKIAAVLGAALAIAACAKNPAEDPNALANANSAAGRRRPAARRISRSMSATGFSLTAIPAN